MEYQVTVARTSYCTFVIEADSQKEADEKAMDKAYNYNSWPSADAEYTLVDQDGYQRPAVYTGDTIFECWTDMTLKGTSTDIIHSLHSMADDIACGYDAGITVCGEWAIEEVAANEAEAEEKEKKDEERAVPKQVLCKLPLQPYV